LRNVRLLAIAQALAACGTFTIFVVGGLVGTELAPQPSLATLPISLSIVGLALTTVPAALLMQRFGRRPAFLGSAACASVAALGAALAIAQDSFAGFCAATLAIGACMAFVQQYRFAAVEYAPAGHAARAVSTVMLGTLGAALVGPGVILTCSELVPGHLHAGTFLGIAALYVLAALVLARLPRGGRATRLAVEGDDEGRPLGEIARDPRFATAVLAGVVGYAVMSFIMTATPIAMHVLHHHDLGATTWVVQSHVFAMYLPALASGFFVERLGITPMMTLGALAMAACVAIAAFAGHAVVHYWWALVLLGVGWNFLFVGGTTLLTTTYRPAERFRAQAVNEFAVFGSQAFASLLAGGLVHQLGWERLNLASLPLIAVLLLALALARRSRATTAA
jgi:MFS family permease